MQDLAHIKRVNNTPPDKAEVYRVQRDKARSALRDVLSYTTTASVPAVVLTQAYAALED